MATYNVGDTVVVRRDLQGSVKYYSHDRSTYNNTTPEMRQLCGKSVHISYVSSDGQYHIEEDTYSFRWTDEMFESIQPAKNDEESRVKDEGISAGTLIKDLFDLYNM